jgi:hypothetical protein
MPRDGETVKKTPARRPAVQSPGDLFDPVETELLRQYFGEAPTLDRALLLREEGDREDEYFDDPREYDPRYGVRLDEIRVDSNQDDASVARAVARICMNVVGRRPFTRVSTSRLGGVAGPGRFKLYTGKRGTARHLFTIDWAMGSWPEAYYTVLVPGFDRQVVVKLSEEEGTGGGCLALGWFEQGKDSESEVRRILVDWWAFQAGFGQERWESFWRAGTIGEQVVSGWADEAWAEAEAEAEADDDESTEVAEG